MSPEKIYWVYCVAYTMSLTGVMPDYSELASKLESYKDDPKVVLAVALGCYDAQQAKHDVGTGKPRPYDMVIDNCRLDRPHRNHERNQ